MATSLFTAADARVLEQLSEGLPNREIARTLGRMLPTIKNRVRRLFIKTGCRNRIELAVFYIKHKHDQR